MEALPGLSRWYTRRMPPCFSAAAANPEAANSDTSAAASIRRLRMFHSLDFRSRWPVERDDSTAEPRRNRQDRRPYWPFGVDAPIEFLHHLPAYAKGGLPLQKV